MSRKKYIVALQTTAKKLTQHMSPPAAMRPHRCKSKISQLQTRLLPPSDPSPVVLPQVSLLEGELKISMTSLIANVDHVWSTVLIPLTQKEKKKSLWVYICTVCIEEMTNHSCAPGRCQSLYGPTSHAGLISPCR